MSRRQHRAASKIKLIAAAIAFITAAIILAAPARAQQRALTAADYARAEKFMGYNTTPLVLNTIGGGGRGGGRGVNWLPDERLTYAVTTGEGTEFILVDPAKGTRADAFDHAKLAAALSAAAGTTYDAHHLPFTDFTLSSDGTSIAFTIAGGARYTCDLPTTKCTAVAGDAQGGRRGGGGGTGRGGRGAAGGRGGAVVSPDGKLAAYIDNYNLWVRPTAGGDPVQLTTDGVKDFGYAIGQRRLDRTATALFSPGRPTRKKSPPINRISAASAKCIWSAPPPDIPNFASGNIRFRAMPSSPPFSASSSM